MMKDVPFEVGFTFDADLHEVPKDPAAMAQAVAWLRTSAAAADGPREKGRQLSKAGVLLRMLRRHDEAEAALAEAKGLLQAAGDARAVKIVELRLAHVWQWQRRFDEALKVLDELEGLVRHGAFPDLKAFVYQHRGKCRFDAGDYAGAARDFEAALAGRKGGDEELEASSRQALAEAQRRAALKS